MTPADALRTDVRAAALLRGGFSRLMIKNQIFKFVKSARRRVPGAKKQGFVARFLLIAGEIDVAIFASQLDTSFLQRALGAPGASINERCAS